MHTIKYLSIIVTLIFLVSDRANAVDETCIHKEQTKFESKFDIGLKKVISDYKQEVKVSNTFGNRPMLNLMLSGEIEKIKVLVRKAGGIVNSVFRDMLTAQIPIDEIGEIAKFPSVHRLELGCEFELHNDTAITLVRADMVHQGYLPLDRKYTGKGVIVGIIDTGIDIFHQEFRGPDDSTKSRIAYLWSQLANNGKNPNGYEYGTELNKSDIESDLFRQTNFFKDSLYDTKGHGTHVAATAAGNGGIAPKSELIIVQVDFNNQNQFLSASILDAVKYIFDKADEMGMPCVINTSFGQRIGIPHDGSDSFSKAIDEIISTKPGRAFVASAGNDGQEYIHWGEFQLEPDSLWIYSWRNKMYFHFPSEFADKIEFKIEVDSIAFPNNIKFGAKTQWTKLSALFENGYSSKDTLFYEYSPTDTACFILYTGGIASDTHSEFEINISEPRKVFNIYKILFRGSGSFNSWNYSYIHDPSMTNGGLPFNDRYVYPDNKYSISSPAVAQNVIAVGSYVNRIQYRDINGNIHPMFPYQSVGQLSTFSSIGPSTDMRIKPDIVAPGETIISARSSNKKQGDSTKLVGDGTYIMFSGTSMSAPIVAGAAALFFEKYPDADFKRVRDAIWNTAIKDEQSQSKGELPNWFWGYGKLDVYAMINNKISSVEDGQHSYSSKGIKISPNPTSNFIAFSISDSIRKESYRDIQILDIHGIEVLRVVINDTAKSALLNQYQDLRIDVSALPPGVYFARIGNRTEKFVKL